MASSRQVARPVVSNLDLVERLVLSVLLGLLAARMVPAVLADANHLNGLLLLSETLAVVFIVFRRPARDISHRAFDWVIGFAGTLAPLLAMPAEGPPVIPITWCALLMIGGLCLQIAAKLTLRRSYGVVAANRGVKVSGPYRFVRHPMYAGYTLTHWALLLSGPNLWNFAVYSLALGLFVTRVVAEERVLRRDPAYQAFAARVPWRLVPFVF